MFFILTPIPGENISIWRIFSNGLKPPVGIGNISSIRVNFPANYLSFTGVMSGNFYKKKHVQRWRGDVVADVQGGPLPVIHGVMVTVNGVTWAPTYKSYNRFSRTHLVRNCHFFSGRPLTKYFYHGDFTSLFSQTCFRKGVWVELIWNLDVIWPNTLSPSGWYLVCRMALLIKLGFPIKKLREGSLGCLWSQMLTRDANATLSPLKTNMASWKIT